ncbi:hypothetical protein QYF36_001799 [Acer negundo]|nr:hypothetical protein QYF36_001799 [Acer negundo]
MVEIEDHRVAATPVRGDLVARVVANVTSGVFDNVMMVEAVGRGNGGDRRLKEAAIEICGWGKAILDSG